MRLERDGTEFKRNFKHNMHMQTKMDAGYHTTDIISIKCPFHLLSIKIKHTKLKGVSRCGFLSLKKAWTKGQLHCSFVFMLKGNRMSNLPLFSGVKGMYVLMKKHSTMGVWMFISKAMHEWTVK